MRPFNRLARLLIPALLIVGVVPGCGANGSFLGIGGMPSTQPALSAQQQAAHDLTIVSQGYTLVLDALVVAEQSGVISPAQFKATAPYRQAVSAAIMSANNAILSNDSTVQTLVASAEAAYATLQAHPAVVASKSVAKPS